MWTITLRDLQFRRRQFGIAVVGAGLVFALTLVLTGISAGFRTEARETVAALAADAWVVPRGVTGPFTSQSASPADLATRLERRHGVREAHAFVDLGHVARLPGGDTENINVIGHDAGRLGDPAWGRGRFAGASGEAVVDERLGVERGDTITVAARRLRVRDVVDGHTYFAGVPVVFVSLGEAQALAFDGRPLASAILIRGRADSLPRGYASRTNAQVRDDLLTPLEGATVVIDTLRLLMWVVAAVIIAAVTYLSALERVRDFAVLKAVGGSSRALALGLAVQAVIASILAAGLAALLAQLLKPAFPVPVTITGSAYLALPLIAVAVGILASLAALRRAVKVDPALAFAG